MNTRINVLILLGIIIAGIIILGNILPIDAQHAEPFQVTYTITEYLSFTFHSKAIQEAAVHNAVTAWAEHLNADVIFIPNAEKKDVFCWIAFTRLSELGAGGGRPGFTCQAEVSKNASQWYFSNHEVKPDGGTHIIRDAEVTLQHELGHGFGLGHYGLGSCQMFASYGGSPDRHCDAELDRLQLLWQDVEPWPDVRTYDTSMKSFSAPSTVVKGDQVVLNWTIENVGTWFTNNIVWFIDWKDIKVIQSGPFYELSPGETFSGTVIWDTSLVSLGEHKVRGCWLGNNFSDPEHQHMNDIDSTNDCIDIFITVTDIAQPPPEPEPEPTPVCIPPEVLINEICMDPEPIPEPEPEPIPRHYTENFSESLGISDSIDVIHIVGEIPDPTPTPTPTPTPDPIIKQLEAEIVILKEDIVILTDVIIVADNLIAGLQNDIVILNDEITNLVQEAETLLAKIFQLNDIISQIRVLVTP